jgi:uncharacterized protein YggT (Ycf19 family)
MYPNDPVRPVEPVEPVEYERPVEPVRPVEYRRDVMTTQEVSPAYRLAQLIYVVFGIGITLIVIRIILKALAANPGAGFTSLIYNITDPLVAPFQGVFSTPRSHDSVLDLAAILAIIVYALLTWLVARLVDLIQRRSAPVA